MESSFSTVLRDLCIPSIIKSTSLLFMQRGGLRETPLSVANSISPLARNSLFSILDIPDLGVKLSFVSLFLTSSSPSRSPNPLTSPTIG